MSHIHDGPLATYNALSDPNLAGFFGNTRMRRQLRRAGLVNRQGDIISENQYRINMARKEHKKHVKDLLAQAIVHKTLDLERYRQVEIKKKLEEIAKIELVRRVRGERKRHQDEALLPLLIPRAELKQKRASKLTKETRKTLIDMERPEMKDNLQPSSATKALVVYVDDDGRPVSPPPSDRQPQEMKTEEIDSRHLYALDSQALQKYALKLSKMERGRDGASSPYVISQIPVPPRQSRPRSERSSPRRSARMSASPPYREKKSASVRGGLMLHRQEPAMMHQGEVQTLCEITMKYHGPNLTLPRDQTDPTQEVSIDQQHCGGNTLPVFRERLRPGSSFSFVSRRHRGYPFSLTLYIDGRVDCRVSTCCEYKHAVGVKLGGKMGHFSLTGITGATPCYKCKLSVQAPPRSLKLRSSRGKKKRSPEQLREEVLVEGTPRTLVDKEEEKKYVSGQNDDDYEDDFEDEESKEKQYEDDFEEEPVEPPPAEEKRQIIGLREDEIRENGRTVTVDVKEQEVKEKQEEEDATLPPHRRIEGYSSEDEDTEPQRKQEVTVDVHAEQKREKPSKPRRSSSPSSSASSSRGSTPHVTPRKETEEKSKEQEPAYVTAISARSEESSLPKTDRSTTSSNSLTTETESTVEPRPAIQKPKLKSQVAISSSSSSSSESDSEDDILERKRRERQRKEEEERRKKEEADRDAERKKKADEYERKRKQEEEERSKKIHLERQASMERMRAFEEERKQRDSEAQAKKEEEERKKAEEREKRRLEEERIRIEHEKELKRIQEQRDYEERIAIEVAEQKAARELAEQKAARELAEQKAARELAEQKAARELAEQKAARELAEQKVAREIAERELAEAQKVVLAGQAEPRRERKSSSSSTSSSSSESDSESEEKKDTQKPPSQVPQAKRVSPPPEPPKVEAKKPVTVESSSSGSSTTGSSTSGSSSGSESEREKEKPAPREAMTTITEEKTEKKIVGADVKPKARLSSSSSSSSESESESDERKKEQKKPEPPTPVKPPSPTPKSSSSTTETSTTSDSELEKTPTRVPTKQASPPPFGGLQHEKALDDKDIKKETPEKQPVKKAESESEDSSSDSSSSGSGSDSETEDDKKQVKPAPKSTSESEGETMHGGADPENVAGGAPKGSNLAQSQVTPAEPQDGNIMPLLQNNTDIDLNGVLLNEDQISQLSSFVVEVDNIKSVSLRNSGITDHLFRRIALALEISSAKPKILNLGLNKLGPESMTHLTAALKKTPSVEVLILNGNPLGDDGYKELVSALVTSKDPFPFLRRSSGYLTPSESRALNPDNSSRAVKTDESDVSTGTCRLTELDLGDTNATDSGITEIARLLETSTTLTSLNLNGNKKVTTAGWARLGQAVGRSKTLKNLSLDFCPLGDNGIEALAKGLRVNTSLRSLELECTGLTERGGLVLRDLLRENTSILQLTVMPGNSVSEGMIGEIRKYLALNNASYT